MKDFSGARDASLNMVRQPKLPSNRVEFKKGLGGFAPRRKLCACAGASYIELTVALGLFAILLLAVLPLLTASGRNLAAAQQGYEAHLAAQGIMLAVRDSARVTSPAALQLATSETAAASAAYRANTDMYRVWVLATGGAGLDELLFTFGSDYAPDVDASLSGLATLDFTGSGRVVLVAVFNEHLHIAGRAVGFVRY